MSTQGISVIWAGDWSSNKTYRRNQAVYYNGSSYRANKTTAQTPSPTATDWDLLALGTVNTGSESNPTTLDELTDVALSNPSSLNILGYDSTTSSWKNLTASTLGLATSTNLNSHTSNTSNPHSTTAAQIGAIPISQRGTANGVATLDGAAKVPDTQIPDSIARDSELTSHTSSTNNPHSVTATQVGRDTAQWNADRIKGVTIDDSAKADGKVLKFNSTSNTLVYSDDFTGAGGGSGEANTVSNLGSIGVGLYKQKVGVNFEFKRLNAGSNLITITDDTANDQVDIDINQANLSLSSIGGTLPIEKGGTNAASVSQARSNLGVPSNTDLANHTTNYSNPHNVTASQVGNTSALWNANKIQGVDVHTATPLNGQVLTFSSTNNRYEPANPTNGTATGGLVKKVKFFSSQTQLLAQTTTPILVGFPQMIITPSSSSNKILIRVCLSGIYVQNNYQFRFQFVRMSDSATLLDFSRIFDNTYPAQNIVTFDFLDSPNTVSLVEYGLYMGSNVLTNVYLNYTQDFINQGYTTVTLMEIAPE